MSKPHTFDTDYVRTRCVFYFIISEGHVLEYIYELRHVGVEISDHNPNCNRDPDGMAFIIDPSQASESVISLDFFDPRKRHLKTSHREHVIEDKDLRLHVDHNVGRRLDFHGISRENITDVSDGTGYVQAVFQVRNSNGR